MLDVERLIGGRWYAVVGAVVLVIGVGMGLKWAYDAGLLRMPPLLRCLSGGVFGVVLIGSGYWLRKRVNGWAAVGATAAGLGSMYVSALAAYKLYTILPPAGAFALLAVVSLIGIVISVQSRLVAVAIVSLVAAYITPLMFLDVHSSPLRFALYLLMLLTTGLGVSAWQGRAFGSLRTLSWSGTLVWGTIWTLFSARHELWLALLFLAAVWGLLHAELLWSAKNVQLLLPVNADPEAPLPTTELGSTRLSRWSTWRPVTISISATFWCVTLGYTVLNANLWPTWPAPAAALLACGTLWLLTALHLDVIRQRPTSDLEVLGVVAAIQIGGLLLTTIALAFGGPTQVVTWLLLAVAAAAASSRLGARAIYYYALLPATIATLRLALWDSWQGVWHAGGYHVLGLQLTPWSMLMLGACGAWLAIARLSSDLCGRWIRPVLTSLALLLLMSAPIHPQSLLLAVAGVWLLIAVLIGVSLYNRNAREPWRLAFAAFPAALATLIIIGNTPSGAGSSSSYTFMGLQLTPWTGFMIAASVVWAVLGAISVRFLPRITFVVSLLFVMVLLMAAPVHPMSERTSLAAVWLAIAIFFAIIGRSPMCGTRVVYFYSLLPAALAAGAIISARPTPDPKLVESTLNLLGLHFSVWSWLMLSAGASWLALAYFSPREGERRVPPAMAVLAVILFMLAGNHPNSTNESLWGWWFLWAIMPGVARSLVPRLRLIFAAVVGAVLCSCLWIILFVPHWTRHGAPLLLQPGLITGLALTAQWSLVAWWLKSEPMRTSAWRSAMVAGLITLFLSTSLEAARVVQRISDDPAARGAGVSLWWGAFAAALLVAGFWRRSSPLRWGGLGLLAVTSLKLVIVDLATVPMVWRTISFIALGLLMIAVPVAYARLDKRSDTQPAPEPSDPARPDLAPHVEMPGHAPGDAMDDPPRDS